MSKLIDVISRVDFDLLNEQTETLVGLERSFSEKLSQLTGTNTISLTSELDSLKKIIDDLTGVIEFHDALMNAAADEGEWVDPTRPDNLEV